MSAMLELVSDNEVSSNDRNSLVVNDEVVSNERNSIILNDDSLIDEVVSNIGEEIKEEPIVTADISIIDVPENLDEPVVYTTKDLIAAYSDYLNALSVLPIGFLDEISVKYNSFVENYKSVPVGLLPKLNMELNKQVQSNDIFLDSSLGNIDYDIDYLMHGIECFYNFSTALSVNSIAKLVRSYKEYRDVCIKVKKEDIENVSLAYAKYNGMYIHFTDEVLKSLNMVPISNSFLDMFTDKFDTIKNVSVSNAIENEQMDVIQDVRSDIVNKQNELEYSITEDVNVKNDVTIVVPHLTSNDFSVLMYSDSENDMTADELCSYNGNIICESVKRVMNNLAIEIKKLEKLKKLIESSFIYNGLFDKDKEYLSKSLFAQGNMRLELFKMMDKDLVSGWDRINGDLGATLDPTLSTSKDAYGVYEEAVKCVKKYENYLQIIKTINSIIVDINRYGFGLDESYLDV